MKQSYDIVIAGVGGQGSLLASRILGALFMSQGFDVKVNEVHGMSQRGGSVVTMVRAGALVRSPMVTAGTADYVLGLEQIEAARGAHYLAAGGTLIASTQLILPTGCDAPAGLTLPRGTVAVPAQELAERAGSARAANVVILGALSARMQLPVEAWLSALESRCKPQTLDINQKAFTLGRGGNLL